MLNPNSVDFVIGQIMERLENGDKVMDRLSVSIDRLSDTINGLPCTSHRNAIKTLMDWKAKLNGRAKFMTEATIQLKYALIVAAVEAVLTVGLTLALVHL
jgi:hypothetical protein